MSEQANTPDDLVEQVESLRKTGLTIQQACAQLGRHWSAYYKLRKEGQPAIPRPDTPPATSHRRGYDLEQQQDGQWKASCKLCGKQYLARKRQGVTNAIGYHFRVHHTATGEQSVERRRVIANVSPPQAHGNNGTGTVSAFYCPGCGLEQTPIVKVYQVAAIAPQIGYHKPHTNGAPSASTLRFCVSCGMDLVPAMRALQAMRGEQQ